MAVASATRCRDQVARGRQPAHQDAEQVPEALVRVAVADRLTRLESDEPMDRGAQRPTGMHGDVCFETKAKSQKAVNLRRDPRISCLVEDGTTYEDLRGASIEGRAEVTDDPDLLWRIGVNIWERYYGPYSEEARPVVEGMLNKRVAVRVKVNRTRSWDHAKLGLGSTGDPGGTTASAPGRRRR